MFADSVAKRTGAVKAGECCGAAPLCQCYNIPGLEISGSIYIYATRPPTSPPSPRPPVGVRRVPMPTSPHPPRQPRRPAAADLHRSPAPWWAGWLARMAGMVAGLVCQSSVNGQPARMRFAGGFSPDGQGQGLGAERQPRAKQGAGTGRKTGRNRKAA